MFKKGVITDEISQDFEVAAKLAAKYNLEALEIRSVWEKGPHELTEEEIDKIIVICKQYNMIVPSISAPFFKCDIDSEEDYSAHIAILKRCIYLAKRVGAKYIRGFTFWAKGSLEEYLPKIVEKYQEPIAILKENNIILALELDPSVFACNATTLNKVVKAVNSPQIKVLWDPGNTIWDTAKEKPYPYGYELLKDNIVHIHLKDAIRRDAKIVEGVAIGTGEVDYHGQFKALIKDGYDGCVMLETHYRLQSEISEEQMASPKGSGFSNGGYEATEESLLAWDKLMIQL